VGGWIEPFIAGGKLRFKVTVQRLVGTQDAAGQEIQTWVTFKDLWASIEPLVGRETVTAQQIYGEITTRIRARYVSGVTPKMRIVYGAQAWDIQGVVNVGHRNRELIMLCVERVEAAGYPETGA
jgi:SPP1 family predicted phage head-tail adaptor